MRCSEPLGISLKVRYEDTRENVFRMIITATQPVWTFASRR